MWRPPRASMSTKPESSRSCFQRFWRGSVRSFRFRISVALRPILPHDTVATYAIAALLVGGATVKQAKVHNVFLGLLLFHALFIVAPQAGNQIFGNPVYGEYFRVFVSYGVIAMALILNAVQTRKLRQQRLRESTRI